VSHFSVGLTCGCILMSWPSSVASVAGTALKCQRLLLKFSGKLHRVSSIRIAYAPKIIGAR